MSDVRNILKEADEIVNGERVKLYGKATDSFQKVAWTMTQLTGKPFTAQDIVTTQIVLKLFRNQNSPNNPDHKIDICGYTAILQQLQEEFNE